MIAGYIAFAAFVLSLTSGIYFFGYAARHA